MTRQSFTRESRLLDSGDFSRVFDCVEFKVSHRYLLILATPNDLLRHRLGLIVAKKNVKLAVQRNRFKRIAREVFRQAPDALPSLDIIIMARRGVDQLDNNTLRMILQQQWQKLTSQ